MPNNNRKKIQLYRNEEIYTPSAQQGLSALEVAKNDLASISLSDGEVIIGRYQETNQNVKTVIAVAHDMSNNNEGMTFFTDSSDFVSRPVVLYQTDGTTGLLGVNEDELGNDWQLENYDFTPYKYLRCYFKMGNFSTTNPNLTPSMVIELPLEAASKSKSAPSGDGQACDMYVAGGVAPNPSDPTTVLSVLVAVDSTKTKFQVVYQNMYDGWQYDDNYSNTPTEANSNGRFLYKIEGCFDALNNASEIEYMEHDPIFTASPAYGITSSDITNWNGKTSNVGTVTGVKMNNTTNNPTDGVVDLGTVVTTETDPTVPSWAKASTKPSYTASEVGAVPTTRTVCGKELSSDISLTSTDVGAVPRSRTVNGKALTGNITLTSQDVGALPDTTVIPTKVSDLTNDSGFTTNVGTITGITMNGVSKGTSGDVDLGTVITEHQTLKTINNQTITGSSNFNLVSKPIVLYETDGTTGLLGVNNNTLGNNWQLENYDFTPYKYLRCYLKMANLATNSNALTPAMIIELPLDDASKATGSGNCDMYVAGHTAVSPSNQNQVYTVLVAVDSTKTKFQVVCENRLYGTVQTNVNSDGRYLYRIEGCFDTLNNAVISPNEAYLEQTTGNSTTSVMSQKAVTDAIEMSPVFKSTYPLMCIQTNGVVISTEKYKKFLFDDLKFVDVTTRFMLFDAGHYYQLQNLFTIAADSSNYITTTFAGNYELTFVNYKNGQKVNESTAIAHSSICLDNHNIYFDFYTKRIILTKCTNTGVQEVVAVVDISSWDFSGLSGKDVYFTKKIYSYTSTAGLIFSYVTVNYPSSLFLKNVLNKRTYPYTTRVFDVFKPSNIIDTSNLITGIYNEGCTVVETISSTHKVLSFNSNASKLIGFGGSGTNVWQVGKYCCWAVKFKLLSGTPTFTVTRRKIVVIGDDGSMTGIQNATFELNKEYVIASSIGTNRAGMPAYDSIYMMKATGEFTFEVYDPVVLYPVVQEICAENLYGGVICGDIPFDAQDVSLISYINGRYRFHENQNYAFYHDGEIKFDGSGKVYMWNGSVWKQISNN